MSEPFKKFYSTSIDFRKALFRETASISSLNDPSHRDIATFILANISSEHGQAAHLLSKEGCYISASSLLRLQFESLMRAQWIYWIAKDTLIERLYKPLTQQHANQVEKHIPTINIILENLTNSADKGGIQLKAVHLLKEFKKVTMKPANSYVHSGMHAFSRKKDGFPEQLVIQIMQNSNGLEALNAMLLAEISDSNTMLMNIVKLQYLYMDSLPMHIPEIMKKFYS